MQSDSIVEVEDFQSKKWTKERLIAIINEQHEELKKLSEENMDLSIQLHSCESALNRERGRFARYENIVHTLVNMPQRHPYEPDSDI